MQYQGRRFYFIEKIEDVDGGASFEKPRGDFGRRGFTAELIKPADLLIRGSGNKSRSKHLPKHRFVPAPTESSQIDQRAIKTVFVRVTTLIRTARVSAVKHESRDALGMLHCIRDTSCGALGNAEECKGPRRIDYVDERLQVLDPTFERKIADIPVSDSATAFIVTNEAEMFAEKTHPVTPNGTLPFVFEVSHPVGGFDERWTRACFRPCELNAVGGT